MSSGTPEERMRSFARVVAKAWDDEAFKQRLIADPKAVLQQEGLPVPAGAEVRVVENNDQLVYFPLPAKPATVSKLSEEDLSQLAGGETCWNTTMTAATIG